ncbi:MAG TPA: DUF3618 domain-containing protein [Lapillicoccus sp.]|jgi:hypothetical protein|uniref:DUF3618 domain-containing protein n=1 Tax=Lapillicoccus sp. TaxID=1909287 RepID=UPI002F955C1E
MSADPDQIRQEIEATRGDLSDNVNALADSVRPGNVARRQVDKVMDGAADLKDRVMGAAGDATDSVGHAGGSAPSAVRRRTRGNPVAAGLVAFGVGWLVASLIPASEVEQQAATALKEKAQPLTDEVTNAAKQVAGNLQEPAQAAVAQVKESAAQSATTVKDEASSSAQSVSSSAQSATDEVKAQAN